MKNTIVVQNNVPLGPNGQLPEIKLSKRDEQLEEMVRIWTTLNPSQKVALLQEATRVWSLNQAIAAFRETPMEALNRKLANERERNECANSSDRWYSQLRDGIN